jgi:hypothetical protein
VQRNIARVDYVARSDDGVSVHGRLAAVDLMWHQRLDHHREQAQKSHQRQMRDFERLVLYKASWVSPSRELRDGAYSLNLALGLHNHLETFALLNVQGRRLQLCVRSMSPHANHAAEKLTAGFDFSARALKAFEHVLRRALTQSRRKHKPTPSDRAHQQTGTRRTSALLVLLPLFVRLEGFRGSEPPLNVHLGRSPAGSA